MNQARHLLCQDALGFRPSRPLGILCLDLADRGYIQEGEIAQEFVNVLVRRVQPELIKGIG